MPKKTVAKKTIAKKTVAKKTASKKKVSTKKVEKKVYAAAPPLPLPTLTAEESKRAHDASVRFEKAVQQVNEQKSEADKIWDEISNKPISMFGLPNQFVFQHCTKVMVEPSKLYVTIRSSAVLPSLETALGPDFSVEMADKFVIVARVPKSTNKK